MDWDQIRKKLSPESNQDTTSDDDSIEIANNSKDPGILPTIYNTISPALNAIIPQAEAGWRDKIRPIKNISNRNFNEKNKGSTPPTIDEIKEHIVNEANRRNLDPALVLAHFQHESSFNPSAINKKGGGKGARGLSQVRSKAFEDAKKFDTTGTLKGLTIEDMSNPEHWKENVTAGLNYYDAINKYWKPKTDEEFLKSYNQGSPKGKGYRSKEAEKYARDVLTKRDQYQKYVDQLNMEKEPILADQTRFNKIRKIIP